MSECNKLKGKPKIRQMVFEAKIPENYIQAYVDCRGLMVIDCDGKEHIIISSDKYKSPTWAFDQFCRALDSKIKGKSK